MRNFLVLVLCLAMVGCAAAGSERESLSLQERIKADVEWYCGPGMLGIRAIARAGLSFFGVPIPDACKLGAAIIEDAEITLDEVENG